MCVLYCNVTTILEFYFKKDYYNCQNVITFKFLKEDEKYEINIKMKQWEILKRLNKMKTKDSDYQRRTNIRLIFTKIEFQAFMMLST